MSQPCLSTAALLAAPLIGPEQAKTFAVFSNACDERPLAFEDQNHCFIPPFHASGFFGLMRRFRRLLMTQHFFGLGEPAVVPAVCAFEETRRMPMKTSQRAARFRDLAAECSSLAATTPLSQMRDQYRSWPAIILFWQRRMGGRRVPASEGSVRRGRNSSLERGPR